MLKLLGDWHGGKLQHNSNIFWKPSVALLIVLICLVDLLFLLGLLAPMGGGLSHQVLGLRLMSVTRDIC
ncbi:hypothetical protein E4T56_gene10204 [Termitomyces sp. T112]|nr:hypothetical protein E4T56_gene10204 [Termitomyces sp. T112]